MDQHLQVFVTVAEKRNFSRAAEELHMTQPAVSQYIRTFEERFGTRLLERTNKYVRLNKAGEIAYHHAKEIVGLYTKMQNLVDDLTNNASGELSIGASYTFGEYILPHVIAQLNRLYPEITPSVTIDNTANIATRMMARQLDVGIVEGHFKEEKQLQTETFAEDEMVLVTSPQHELVAHKNPITTADLAVQTWILRESGSGTREASDMMLKHMHITPARKISFGSTQAVKEAVSAGLGISLLSKWAVQKELRHGELNIVETSDMPFIRQFYIVTASPFQTKAMQVFLELLRVRKWSRDI